MPTLFCSAHTDQMTCQEAAKAFQARLQSAKTKLRYQNETEKLFMFGVNWFFTVTSEGAMTRVSKRASGDSVAHNNKDLRAAAPRIG